MLKAECKHEILICVLPPGKRIIIKLTARIPKTTTTTQKTALTRRLTYYNGNFTSKTGQAFLLKGIWFGFCFTALRHILGHFGRGQLT